MAKMLMGEKQLIGGDASAASGVRRTALEWRLPQGIVLLTILALAALLPQFTENQSVLNLLFLVFLNVALSESWNILAGFAGQISLGHAAFFGLGALVMRTLWTNGAPLALAIAAAAIVPTVVALIIGVPTFRLRGVYFAVGTLAMAEALRITVANVLPLVTTLPGKVIASYDLSQRYYLALAVALATVSAAYLLLRSRYSLGLLAVREDEVAAQATGVNPVTHKLLALALCGLFAGLAGATFAFYQVSYYPELAFSSSWTFDALLITFVGGLGTLAGPIIGALFYIVVRERLAVTLVNLHPIIFGGLFIVIVLAFPGGLMDIGARFKQWAARLGRG